MSARESLYKGMFRGHVSLHPRWNSCPKTQNVHALDCNNLPYAGLYTVTGNQLRPCGQRSPDSWVSLSLFISITWVEVRRARSSLSPVTEHVSTVYLTAEATFKVDLSQSLILTRSSSGRQDVVQTQFPTSPWLRCSGPGKLFLPVSEQNQAGEEAAQRALLLNIQQGQPDPGRSATAT